MPSLLELKNIKKYYKVKSGYFSEANLYALNGLNIKLQKGKTLAVVGESGCGKSTLAKVILGIENPTEGEILWDQKNLLEFTKLERARKVGIVFQDPTSSFNPRKTIRQILIEPLLIQGGLTDEQIELRLMEVIGQVGIRPDLLGRYPHMFSGGQKQRIAIARALMNTPELLICDEPVSALDISIQGQILNLLKELQQKYNLTLLFISHDLSVVRFISDEVLVMYLGKIVEFGETKEVMQNPQHPYTKLLVESTPSIKGNLDFRQLELQELPSPLNLPKGCAFQGRCSKVKEACYQKPPELVEVGKVRVACFEVKNA